MKTDFPSHQRSNGVKINTIYKKQIQAKNTMNSGRSIKNKRIIHDQNYHSQSMKPVNKSASLCLNNQNFSTINHKVIHNFKDINNAKISQISSVNQGKIKKNKHENQSNNCLIKKKSRKSSRQSSQNAKKIHSHRQSLMLMNGKCISSVINSSRNRNCSQNKQNICSNIQEDQQNVKKKYSKQSKENQSNSRNSTTIAAIDNCKFSLNKLNFILQKTCKQKSNLTKKKLHLSSANNNNACLQNDCNEKENKTRKFNCHDQGQVKIKENKSNRNEINSSKSISKSKNNSIGSSRNQSIDKCKAKYSHLKTKDTSSCQSNHQIELASLETKNKFEQKNDKKTSKVNEKVKQNSKSKSYLKIKPSSINHYTIYPSQEDQKSNNQNASVHMTHCEEEKSSYSIKSLLKMLINSQNSAQHELKNIINSLTNCKDIQSNHNAESKQKAEENQSQQKHSQQTQTSGEFIIHNFLQKINDFQQIQTTQPEQTLQSGRQKASLQKSNYKQQQKSISADKNKNNINSQTNQIDKISKISQKQNKIIKRYQIKITNLYQELIKQKQKRYQLQEIIEKYISQKESEQKSKQNSSEKYHKWHKKQQNCFNYINKPDFIEFKPSFQYKSIR